MPKMLRGNTSRRNFLSEALISWISLTLLPAFYAIVEYIIPPRSKESIITNVHVAKFADLPLGSGRIIRVNKKAVALVKTQEGQVKAFSAVCTHLGCIVQYKEDKKNFQCNCHGSVFDLSGKNIAGPAPKPLSPFRVDVKGDAIFISQL